MSLALGASAGFTLGLILLWAIALGHVESLPWAALVQVHGQVQTLGFVGLFVLGTAAQLLPGFLARPLVQRRPIIAGGALLATGLLIRSIAQPLDPGVGRDVMLWLSAVGELAGVGMCLLSYARIARQSIQPGDLWRTFAAIGFGFLLVSVVLNFGAVAALTAGISVVPVSLDTALVDLELRGFVVFVAFGVSRKILPRFLLLPPPNDRRLGVAGGIYLVGILLDAAGWLTGPDWSGSSELRIAGAWATLVGVLLYLMGLHLYHAPIRPSGAPNVTEPARRWLRIAFGWLLVAQTLGIIWATRALLGGSLASFFEQTAERHALAQGFVMIVLVAYAARILPGFSACAITHGRRLTALVGLLTAGAALRVVGELGNAMLGAPAEVVAGCGGALSVIGFFFFDAALARTLSSGPRQH